jgi:tetratricopeptide (TPR) repeat protein
VLQLIENSSFASAAKLAREALEVFPDDPELTMLNGLALVQSGKIDAGTAQLKLSTELDPTNAETFYNLALALCNQGDHHEAEVYAREALKIDPEHAGALNTLSKCEGASFRAEGESVEVSPISIRPGPDDPEIHILNLGDAWTRIGFVLAGYCVLSFIYVVAHPFVTNEGKPDPHNKLSFFLYITAGLGTLFWTLIDVIDRRDKFVWLLPMFVCGVTALPVLPLTLYLALRKRMVRNW